MKNLETGFFVYGPLSCGKTLIALVKRELLSFISMPVLVLLSSFCTTVGTCYIQIP